MQPVKVTGYVAGSDFNGHIRVINRYTLAGYVTVHIATGCITVIDS